MMVMEQQQGHGEWDAVEAFMECVTTCVRTYLGPDQELWQSSLCL